MQLAPPHACRRHCELVADLQRPIALSDRVRDCAIGPRRAVMARKSDEPRTAGTDLRDRARNIALTDRSPRRVGIANGRLQQEWRAECMYRQVQAAVDRADRHIKNQLADGEHALNTGMAAAADEHEAEAAYVHDDRLLGDRTEPEHHLRQRRQEGDARAIARGPVVRTTSAR